MTYLLTYEYDSDSGNGPYHADFSETYCDESGLMEELESIQTQLASDRHYYDTQWDFKDGEKYKPKTYKPCIRNIHIYRLKEMVDWKLPQDPYDREYRRREHMRKKSFNDARAARKASYEKLHAEFGETS